MKRRHALLLAVTGLMIAVAAIGFQKKPNLLVLEWAAKAAPESPPSAVLIELGNKDAKPTPWSGRATVTGAKVVHREGYRFRTEDKLLDPDGWEASSHRPLRLPKGNAAAAVREGIATVGVVLHLADIKPDATLTVAAGKDRDKIVVPLKEVLAGKATPLWNGLGVVRLVTTATPVVTAKTEDDFPAACYGPDGTLWLAYISYTLKDESRRVELAQIKEQPKDFKAYYTPEFGDQLFVKYYRDGKWSEPIAVTDNKQDLVGCAIAAEGNGDVCVVYSANREGKHNIYARSISKKYSPEAKASPEARPGPEQRLAEGDRVLSPDITTDQVGTLFVTFQTWDAKGIAEFRLLCGGNGNWTEGLGLGLNQRYSNHGDGNTWHPAITVGPSGELACAYDCYNEGDSDIGILVKRGLGENSRVASTSRFEARPSVCYDAKDRLWIAYEEGPEQWGKNFGALDQKGNPLYFARTVKVVCMQDGKLMRPVAELPPLPDKVESPDTGQKAESAPRYSNPQIGLDGKGRVWLTYRQKFGTRNTSHLGSHWLTFARRLDGDKWTEPIEVHHSDGMLDSRPVVLPHQNGGLRIIHTTDGRYTTPENIDSQIYMSYIDLPGESVEPKLVPHDPGKKDDKLVQQAKAEQEAVKRIRDYRVQADGKKYQLLRGEFHRHTEISFDGGPDGSLEDMFRYAIDAAAMDWIGNADHDNGGGREYTWWLTQKMSDAYHVKDHFTPMFTYERSVPYPHGHRNCMFAQRGVRTLPRLAPPSSEAAVAGVHAEDAKMLYRYLHEFNGLCASHTSATGMGTDWRDNDPVVEPVVEIYQGDRMSYEIEGAPRAGYDPQTGTKPANIGGWKPAGFINLALQKGYRLGFQSSSDHFSTHISFCIVLAERHDRAGILDGLKKRHCYAATDDIIVDVGSGTHVMGDEFKTANAPTLELHVIGTNTLAKIDIMKDSEVVATLKPGQREYKAAWTDPKPAAGVHYYYIRVLQTDDEIAWSSPMWIDYAK